MRVSTHVINKSSIVHRQTHFLIRLYACLPSRTFCDKRKFMDILDRELFRAVSEGNLDGVREALRRGAHVDARDKYMQTPLFYVAVDDVLDESEIAKRIEIGEELLRAGADLEARSSGMRIRQIHHLLPSKLPQLLHHFLRVPLLPQHLCIGRLLRQQHPVRRLPFRKL